VRSRSRSPTGTQSASSQVPRIMPAACTVEVKSPLKTDDVLKFQRKAAFAKAKLGRPLTRLIIALSMDSKAEALMQRLGIDYQVRATLE
jgi:hypothetical protein